VIDLNTKLNIELNTEDSKHIYDDLKSMIKGKSGLSVETYLLFNKIKGFCCAYTCIENDD